MQCTMYVCNRKCTKNLFAFLLFQWLCECNTFTHEIFAVRVRFNRCQFFVVAVRIFQQPQSLQRTRKDPRCFQHIRFTSLRCVRRFLFYFVWVEQRAIDNRCMHTHSRGKCVNHNSLHKQRTQNIGDTKNIILHLCSAAPAGISLWFKFALIYVRFIWCNNLFTFTKLSRFWDDANRDFLIASIRIKIHRKFLRNRIVPIAFVRMTTECIHSLPLMNPFRNKIQPQQQQNIVDDGKLWAARWMALNVMTIDKFPTDFYSHLLMENVTFLRE